MPDVEIGLDWDEAGGQFAVVGERGVVLHNRKYPATPTGAEEVLALFREYADPDGTLPWLVMEGTRRPFVRVLQDAGVPAIACNPNAFGKRNQGRNDSKTDAKDAVKLVTESRLAPERFREQPEPSDGAWAITLFTRRAKNSVLKVTTLAGEARSLLAEFFPAALTAYSPLDLGQKPEACAVLTAFPTPTRAAAATLAEIEQAIRSTGKVRWVKPMAAKTHAAFQQERLQYAPGLEADYGEVLVGLLRELKAAMDNRVLLDEAVRVRVERHFVWDLLSPAPGAGMSVISRVLAEMGDDPARFEDKGGLAAFAGVAPKMHQSGEFTGTPGRRSVKGNRLHQAYWDWASSAMLWSPGAMEYYWAHRARGDKHPTAIRKVGRRLANGTWHCLRTGEVWNEATLWPGAPTLAEAKGNAQPIRDLVAARRKEAAKANSKTDLRISKRRKAELAAKTAKPLRAPVTHLPSLRPPVLR